ncbi:MAG TPA: amidohydrolase family protein, partial [Burkholderiales bacterium]|nr:amidohydrolase family protein [Burkholderiales bacterium]
MQATSEANTIAGICDCHMHIYDPRFKPSGHVPPRDATMADYRRIREQLGLERVVVVQSTAYGFDNSCTLDAIKQLGANARG